jgi:hypothetical protein
MQRSILVSFSALTSLLTLGATAFAGDDSATARPPLPACAQQKPDFNFTIRSDFNDLGPLSCQTPYAYAQGANLSATNNLLTHQNSAAIDGLAALDYRRYYNDGNIIGYAVGAYVQVNDTYQFNPTKSQAINGDTVTPGGFGEIAFYDPFTRIVQGKDDFRIRGGEAISSTGATSQTVVGEWIPSYVLGSVLGNRPGYNIGFPNQVGFLWYTPAPELIVQYDRLTGGTSTALIFASRREALRIGPQFLLQLSLDQKSLAHLPPLIRDILGNSSALITNHESWDAYTGKAYSWTALSFSYTFPQFAHLGLTTSYGYGNLEASGNKTSQVKLGLAAKF